MHLQLHSLPMCCFPKLTGKGSGSTWSLVSSASVLSLGLRAPIHFLLHPSFIRVLLVLAFQSFWFLRFTLGQNLRMLRDKATSFQEATATTAKITNTAEDASEGSEQGPITHLPSISPSSFSLSPHVFSISFRLPFIFHPVRNRIWSHLMWTRKRSGHARAGFVMAEASWCMLGRLRVTREFL